MEAKGCFQFYFYRWMCYFDVKCISYYKFYLKIEISHIEAALEGVPCMSLSLLIYMSQLVLPLDQGWVLDHTQPMKRTEIRIQRP